MKRTLLGLLLTLLAATGCGPAPEDVEAILPVMELPPSAEAERLLAEAHKRARAGQYKEAAELGLHAAEAHPRTAPGAEIAFRTVGWLIDSGDLEGAERQALAADANEAILPRTVPRVHAAAGEAFYRLGMGFLKRILDETAEDEDEAADKVFDYCERSLAHDPNGLSASYAQLKIGEVHLHREEYEEAKEQFETLLDRYPHSDVRSAAQHLLARTILYLEPTTSDKRIARAREALEAGKAELDRIVNSEQRDLQQKEIDEALAVVDEEEARQMFEYAEIFRRYGQPQAAVAYYDLLIRSYPRSELVKLSQQRRDRLAPDSSEKRAIHE